MKSWLTGLGIFASLAIALYVQTLRLHHADERLATAQAQTLEAAETIAELERLQREREAQRAALAAQTRDLQKELDQRAVQIGSLQRENEDLRQWATRPLPSLVVRMRDRPSIIGAEDYRQHLRDAGSVPLTSEQPTHPRRAEPANRDD